MSALLKTILLVFEEIFYFVFPLSADELLIKNQTPPQFLAKLDVRICNNVVVLANFKDPAVRAALHLVKFHRHKKATVLVSALFAAWLNVHTEAGTVIVPIPLSKQRERERGFNQSALIAQQAVAEIPGCNINLNVLVRQKHTAPQTSLSRQDRLKNLENAFAAARDAKTLAGKHVILFDDVLTTGATLQAAKAQLLPLDPASVTCVAIAN